MKIAKYAAAGIIWLTLLAKAVDSKEEIQPTEIQWKVIEFIEIRGDMRLLLRLENTSTKVIEVELDALLAEIQSFTVTSVSEKKEWANYSYTPISAQKPASIIRLQGGAALELVGYAPASELFAEPIFSEVISFVGPRCVEGGKFMVSRVKGQEIVIKRMEAHGP